MTKKKKIVSTRKLRKNNILSFNEYIFFVYIVLIVTKKNMKQLNTRKKKKSFLRQELNTRQKTFTSLLQRATQ